MATPQRSRPQPTDDYGASEVAGTVTFNDPATSTTVNIPVKGDTLDELDETFRVTLTTITAGSITSTPNGSSTVTILDDDDPPTVSAAADFGVTEGNGTSTTTADVVVTLSALSGLPVSVVYTTADIDATANTDYDQADGATLTIPKGQMSGTFKITVNGDDTFEDDETFTVTLSNATTTSTTTPLTITVTTTVVTIRNDDNPATTEDTGVTNEDTAFTSTASVLANDPSSAAATLTAVNFSTPAKGVLTPQSDGTYHYDPNGDFESLDTSENEIVTFTYEARFTGAGGPLDSDPTTTTITVTGVNDAPVAEDGFFPVLPAATTSFDASSGLATLVSDVDDTTFTFVQVGSVSIGTISAFSASDGSFSYNPGTFVGNATFQFKANDGEVDSNTATVTLGQGPTLIMTVVTSTGSVDIGKVDEDTAGAQFKVRIDLINGTTTNSIATFKTANGTAVSGTDFVGHSGTAVSLNKNNTTTSITVSVRNDTGTTYGPPVREGTESFEVALSNPNSGTIIAGGFQGLVVSSTLQIIDPSDAPMLSVLDITVTEPNSVDTADVVVQLTGRTLLGAEVDFATADGTSTTTDNAMAPDDYMTTSTTVVFGANATAASVTQTVSVGLVDDIVDEFDELFNAMLSGATEPAGSPGQITNLTITDDTADVTIEDSDLPPVLVMSDPMYVVEAGTATVDVTLIGASSRGVTVDAMPIGGTATADSDYTSTTSALSWAADATGVRQFTVVTLTDTTEEPAESVILKLVNASTTGADGVVLSDTNGTDGVSAVRSDGVQADATAVLEIRDDEPAMKVVTVVSDPEGMPGDPYFLVFTGAPSATPPEGLTAIANVPELLQKTFGLDEVRSKPATHVSMGMVSTSDPLGVKTFSYTVSGTPVTADLNIVGARTNRSFYLFPGANFTGLGLVPKDPSIAKQLKQTVPNASQDLIAAIKANNPDNTELDRDVVKLEDVVDTVWAFSAAATNPGWKAYYTVDPLTRIPRGGGVLTDLEAFQGMIITTRSEATGPTAPVAVFDEATASPTMYPVPVRIDIEGPFLQPGNVAPVSTVLGRGFNLIAPHVWADTPYDTVFGGTGGDISETFSTAVTRERAIVSSDPTSVAVVDRWLTESVSIPPFEAPGVIFPELSYWVRVVATVAQDPVLTATGPSVGGGP